MEAIRKVLAHFEYDAAFRLYDRLTGDSLTKTVLEKGENSYTREKLRSELAKLLDDPKTIEAPRLHKAQPTAEPRQLSPQAAQVDEAWREQYKEASYYHQRLESEEDPEERREMCLKILELFEGVHQAWDDLREYDATGEIPKKEEKPDVELTDPLAMVNRIRALRVYISQAKSGKKYSPERIPEFQAEIEVLTKRIQ